MFNNFRRSWYGENTKRIRGTQLQNVRADVLNGLSSTVSVESILRCSRQEPSFTQNRHVIASLRTPCRTESWLLEQNAAILLERRAAEEVCGRTGGTAKDVVDEAVWRFFAACVIVATARFPHGLRESEKLQLSAADVRPRSLRPRSVTQRRWFDDRVLAGQA